MSGSEPRTSPDYYEKPLTEDSRLARKALEDSLSALDEELDAAKGIERLRLQKRRDRVQRNLDWQGADPRELDFGELKEAIREPIGDDNVEDTYRSRIRNQSTAIRAYCVMCQGGSVAGIKDCPATTCTLFPFRMGKDPLRGYELPKVEEALSDEDMTEEELDDDSEDEDEDDSDED